MKHVEDLASENIVTNKFALKIDNSRLEAFICL